MTTSEQKNPGADNPSTLSAYEEKVDDNYILFIRQQRKLLQVTEFKIVQKGQAALNAVVANCIVLVYSLQT